MKRPVRPLFNMLLLLVVAVTCVCRVAVRNGFGFNYEDRDIRTHWGYGSSKVNFPLSNSSLLKLAEVDSSDAQLRRKINHLLHGRFTNFSRFKTYIMWRWRRLFNTRSTEFTRVWNEFTQTLTNWASSRKFEPDIMDRLVDQIKVPITGSKRKYSSCAVVGNSGILLTKEFGYLIDSHEAVIRLKNAKIEPYQINVGSKTTISFVNSNILHDCAKKKDCFCHPYGTDIPIVMYTSQPVHLFDYVVCSSTHTSDLILIDRQFDILCGRIVKYYSLKRFVDGNGNRTLEEWNSAHKGSLFHYSSGMQAVMMALGICDRVGLFGFGKLDGSKHHYHTNQTKELSLHDYEAEYEFYDDLVKKPRAIPFFSGSFRFPPVVMYR